MTKITKEELLQKYNETVEARKTVKAVINEKTILIDKLNLSDKVYPKVGNIHQMNANQAVQVYAELKELKEFDNSMETSAEELGLSGMYNRQDSYYRISIDDWISGVKLRAGILKLEEQSAELKILSKKISDFLSNEDKFQLAFQDVDLSILDIQKEIK